MGFVMATYIISAADAEKNFPSLLSQVSLQGVTLDIQQGNGIVARMSPISPAKQLLIKDLDLFFANLPHLANNDADDFLADIHSGLMPLQGDGEHTWDS
jgi:hypothetical protein